MGKQTSKDQGHKDQRKALLILLCVFVSLIVLICLFNQNAFGETATKWLYDVLNLALGINTTNEQTKIAHFPVLLAIRIMLAIGPILGIGWVVLEMLSRRTNTMKLFTTVKMRDAEVIGQLKNSLTQYMSEDEKKRFMEGADKELKGIFTAATDGWKITLVDMYGEAIATQIIEHMEMEMEITPMPA